MKHFNKDFKNENQKGGMAIIGDSSGPTAIFLTEIDNKREEEHEKFLSFAAEKIIPCDKTFRQLEDYIVKKYKAIPHTLLPYQLNSLKVNVILNYFNYVLKRPEPLGENPSNDEIKAYLEKDTSILQAKEYPAEKLGLQMKAYKLPNVASQIRMNQEQSKQNIISNCSNNEIDVIVEMEMKSEYFNVRNGGEEVIQDLLIYRGVSEKDIKDKSQRFVAYAYALKFFKKL